MKVYSLVLAHALFLLGCPLPAPVPTVVYLTTADQTQLLARQDSVPAPIATADLPTIEVTPADSFQIMDGFGFTLTGGSALHLHRMPAAERQALLNELFGEGRPAIGISYLRLSLGASDLDERVFSYRDLPPGETDPARAPFSLAPDETHLIPVLREILAINPDIKIMASPWSPPVWMKSNGSSIGGSLLPEYYPAYAEYFVDYIQGMAERGVPIDAVTVQNEPLHPGNNPSLLMPADEQAAFIKDHLGPAFAEARLTTKIIIYDHNADRPDYPISILDDPEARPYIDGSAFHLYGGEIENLSQVHAAYPDKHLYFTEQWIGAPGDFPNDLRWHVRHLIIGATRNWCKTVLEWNLAADPNQDPHTEGGCTRCLGAVTIDGAEVTRNPAYYIIGHAAKFVRPGSVRIGSTVPEGLPNVAFLTPRGNVAQIVLNDTDTERSFVLRIGERVLRTSLPGGAVATYVWP